MGLSPPANRAEARDAPDISSAAGANGRGIAAAGTSIGGGRETGKPSPASCTGTTVGGHSVSTTRGWVGDGAIARDWGNASNGTAFATKRLGAIRLRPGAGGPGRAGATAGTAGLTGSCLACSIPDSGVCGTTLSASTPIKRRSSTVLDTDSGAGANAIGTATAAGGPAVALLAASMGPVPFRSQGMAKSGMAAKMRWTTSRLGLLRPERMWLTIGRATPITSANCVGVSCRLSNRVLMRSTIVRILVTNVALETSSQESLKKHSPLQFC